MPHRPTSMNGKRSLETDQVTIHNSPLHPIERAKMEEPTAISKTDIGRDFEIPEVIALLRNKVHEPWSFGYTIGVMQYHISPVVSKHLDSANDFRNKIPKSLAHVWQIVPALDMYIRHLRTTDGCSEKFPNDDREAQKKRRKYIGRYTYMAEATFKNYIRGALGNVFEGWSVEQTRLFNKGMDKALSGIQWVLYPEKNVLVEAGEGDWAVWLRSECEELGMEGRPALEDYGTCLVDHATTCRFD
jgi:hypothetical protein